MVQGFGNLGRSGLCCAIAQGLDPRGRHVRGLPASLLSPYKESERRRLGLNPGETVTAVTEPKSGMVSATDQRSNLVLDCIGAVKRVKGIHGQPSGRKETLSLTSCVGFADVWD